MAIQIRSRKLTAGELEVLHALMIGQRYAAIQRELGITKGALSGRVRSIFNKLGADNRTAAVLFAIDLGVIAPDAFYGS